MRRSSRRAATFPSSARRASFGAPARASTTWTISPSAPAKMAGFIRAHRERRQSRRRRSGSAIRTAPTSWRRCCLPNPALFDAAVLMHPLIPFEPDISGDLAGKRILITAGRRDPICPPNLTSRLEAHLRAAKADVTVEWHEGGHEVQAERDRGGAAFPGAARRSSRNEPEPPCDERRTAGDRAGGQRLEGPLFPALAGRRGRRDDLQQGRRAA